MTAQTGAWGFGPQVDKDTAPDTWYRHKAINVGAGVQDMAGPGQPEVGGVPVPTIAHKAGYSVGGVIDIMPRFEGTFGWLLHALMGGYASGADFHEGYILATEALTIGAQAGFAVDAGLPVATGRKACVKIEALGGTSFTGTVTVNGTDASDLPLTEDFVFAAGALYDRIDGTEVFKTITSVDLPAYEALGDAVSVGYESGVAHTFKFNPSDPAAVKWLGMRKYIPKVDGGANTDLLEEYTGCRIANFSMQLTNLGLMQSQIAWRGRDYEHIDTEPADWDNTYENDLTVPVSIKTDGYVKLLGTGLSEEKLKIINATIGMSNQFVSERVDRIYGDPRLYSLEVASRQLQLTLLARWDNPEVYRAVTDAATNGTVWSPEPLIGELDMRASSIANMTGETQPWSIRFQAERAMLSITNPVGLQSNNVVLLQLNLLAFDNPTGEYATVTLRNKQASGFYTWPT